MAFRIGPNFDASKFIRGAGIQHRRPRRPLFDNPMTATKTRFQRIEPHWRPQAERKQSDENRKVIPEQLPPIDATGEERSSKKRASTHHDEGFDIVQSSPCKRFRKNTWWIVDNCAWIFWFIDLWLGQTNAPTSVVAREQSELLQQGAVTIEHARQSEQHPRYSRVNGRWVYVTDAGLSAAPYSGSGRPKQYGTTLPPTQHPYTDDTVAKSKSESPITPSKTVDQDAEATLTHPPNTLSEIASSRRPASTPTQPWPGGHTITLPGGITHVTGPPIRQLNIKNTSRTSQRNRFAPLPPRRYDVQRDEQGRLVNEEGRPVDEKGRLMDRHNRLIDEHGQLVDEHGRIPFNLFEDESDHPVPRRYAEISPIPLHPKAPTPSSPQRDEQIYLLNDQGYSADLRDYSASSPDHLLSEEDRLSEGSTETPVDLLQDLGEPPSQSQAPPQQNPAKGLTNSLAAGEPSHPTTDSAAVLEDEILGQGPLPTTNQSQLSNYSETTKYGNNTVRKRHGRLPTGWDESDEDKDEAVQQNLDTNSSRYHLPPNEFIIKGTPIGRYGLPLAPDMVVQDEELPVPPLDLEHKYMDDWPAEGLRCSWDNPKCNEMCTDTFSTRRALREHERTHEYMMFGGTGKTSIIIRGILKRNALPQGEGRRLLRERKITKRVTFEEDMWDA